MRARIEFKLEDFWIGAFWRTSWAEGAVATVQYDLWICLIPCLPLHLTWYDDRLE